MNYIVKILKEKKGAVLIVVFVVMIAIFLLISYYLQFIITETKISASHRLATQAYYLSEAGVQEAMWKIRHDPDWLSNFQSVADWQTTLERTNPFGLAGSYYITVANIEIGRAEIAASSTIDYGQQISQRRVKTIVFQPQGTSATNSIAILANDDVNFTGSIISVIGAGMHVNDDINLNLFSQVDLDGKASAVDQISVAFGSNLTASLIESVNNPPAAERFEMPQIDFDSGDPNSFLSRADNVYTNSQFNALIRDDPDLVLNGITYVTGNVIVPRGADLTVNGTLVADGNINVGTDFWPIWKSNPTLTVNDPGSGPVGVLTKQKINLGAYTGMIDVTGLFYATDEFKLDAFGSTFLLTGGIVARKMVFNSLWQNLEIYGNDLLISRTLGSPLTAPIINIEHWEEEY